MSDPELLQRYVETGSQEAFAVLVKRHLDLVYSAARRQVRSPQLAEEVAQSVFLDLSRQARTLQSGAPLAAWLYLVTRRTSIDVVRRESRRQAREQTAVAIAAMNTSPPAWINVEPLLDEAMESLDETDRSAVLLRYFENQSLREVGQSLGTSEDAAQKRVSRAVDQLRLFFTKRGVAVTAAGLTTDLSANAVQTAPAVLGASISAATAALGTTAGHVLLLETTKTIFMTTLQKTAFTAALVLVAGAGLYEASMLYLQHDNLKNQRDQVAHLTAQIASLQAQRTSTARQTALVQRQIEALQANAAETKVVGDPALEAEMRAWYVREQQMREAFDQNPQLKIPELQLLTDKDWFSAAQTTKLATPDQLREALGSLRSAAKSKLMQPMMTALQAYIAAHDKTMPDEPLQLQPYFKPPIDPAILEHYEMSRTGSAKDWPKNSAGIVIREKDAIDLEYDSHMEFGINGGSVGTALGYAVRQAQKDYAAANGSQRATNPMQLMPYLKVSVDPNKLLPYLKP